MAKNTQKKRREIMSEHGHKAGVYIEFFGDDGRSWLLAENYGTEDEIRAFIHTWQSHIRRHTKGNKEVQEVDDE